MPPGRASRPQANLLRVLQLLACSIRDYDVAVNLHVYSAKAMAEGVAKQALNVGHSVRPTV